MSCVYIAPVDRVAELKDEIRHITFEQGNFLIAEGPLQKSYWAQNIWSDIQRAPVESIQKAANTLKAIQRRWWHFPLQAVRRTKLIQEALPPLKHSPLAFPTTLSSSPLGSFALLSENEMIFSPDCSSPLPNGESLFAAPQEIMPSEAYLKLWEALTLLARFPKHGEHCLDLGSSPGSWTQALLNLGARVTSVDKADLSLAASERLKFLRQDAFKLEPQDVEEPQWIFSDIICYPEKLLELGRKWRAAYPQATFVFTIKFQGKWDKGIVSQFRQIPHSQVRHLYNNKHELCWMHGS